MGWQERPGPVHLELPEDVAADSAPEMKPVPPHPIDLPIAQPAALDRAAGLIRNTERPRIMLGAAASRPRLAACLSDFVRRLQEKPPFLMGPKGPTVLHVGYLPATVEEVYFPHAELIGDVGPRLALLADACSPRVVTATS